MIGPRPERGGPVFSLGAIELLRGVYAAHHEIDSAHRALLDAGFNLTRSQVSEGVNRYCRDEVRPIGAAPPSLLEMNFGPKPRPPDRVRKVAPGTFPVPTGGFRIGAVR